MIRSRSPSLARRAGPGTRPLNVQAGKKMPGAISISLSMASTSKVRSVRPSGRSSVRASLPVRQHGGRIEPVRVVIDQTDRCHVAMRHARTSVRHRDRSAWRTCRDRPSGQVRFATVRCQRRSAAPPAAAKPPTSKARRDGSTRCVRSSAGMDRDFPQAAAPKSWREKLDKANNLPRAFTCQSSSCETGPMMQMILMKTHAASRRPRPPTRAPRRFRACARRGATNWPKTTSN